MKKTLSKLMLILAVLLTAIHPISASAAPSAEIGSLGDWYGCTATFTLSGATATLTTKADPGKTCTGLLAFYAPGSPNQYPESLISAGPTPKLPGSTVITLPRVCDIEVDFFNVPDHVLAILRNQYSDTSLTWILISTACAPPATTTVPATTTTTEVSPSTTTTVPASTTTTVVGPTTTVLATTTTVPSTSTTVVTTTTLPSQTTTIPPTTTVPPSPEQLAFTGINWLGLGFVAAILFVLGIIVLGLSHHRKVKK